MALSLSHFSFFFSLIFVLTIINSVHAEIWPLRPLNFPNRKRNGVKLIPHRFLRHRQTPYAQIQLSAHAILREHQLLSSLGVPYLANFRNQESKSQRFLMSFYVMSYPLMFYLLDSVIILLFEVAVFLHPYLR